jgi:TM2 domain-containing membrane protein YozV/Tfp pilus assembly protein PilE
MASLLFCGACRKQVTASDAACPHCNAPRGRRYKDRTTAGLLAVLLGGIGVHRFYLGQWWGVFYLLFFWLGLPALIAVIEGIIILCMSQERWDERYNDGIRTASDSSRVGVAIALGAVAFIGLFVLGILAAIAIPAYADYTARAKVFGALATAQRAADAVEAYVNENSSLPASLADAGFTDPLPAHVQAIELDESNGDVVVTMSGPPFDDSGATFALSPTTDGSSSGIIWRCSAIAIRERHMPQHCRQPRD